MKIKVTAIFKETRAKLDIDGKNYEVLTNNVTNCLVLYDSAARIQVLKEGDALFETIKDLIEELE